MTWENICVTLIWQHIVVIQYLVMCCCALIHKLWSQHKAWASSFYYEIDMHYRHEFYELICMNETSSCTNSTVIPLDVWSNFSASHCSLQAYLKLHKQLAISANYEIKVIIRVVTVLISYTLKLITSMATTTCMELFEENTLE